jgi:hypothetical protein
MTRTAPATELRWEPVGETADLFGLSSRHGVVASLRWDRSARTASASASGRYWTFLGQASGLVVVEVRERQKEVATYAPGPVSGGTLTTGRGGAYRWSPLDVMATRWQWRDAQRRPLLVLDGGGARRGGAGLVRVADAATGHGDVALLATLGWYLLVSELGLAETGGEPSVERRAASA